MEYERYSVCMLSPMIHRRPNGHSENEDQVEACVCGVLQTEYTLCGHAVRRSCHSTMKGAPRLGVVGNVQLVLSASPHHQGGI